MKWKTNARKISAVVLPILGISTILALVALIWWWETDGRQRAFYVDVPVLKVDVKRGDLIIADMLTTMKIERDKLIDRYVRDPNEILGLSAKHYIPKSMQLDPQFFETYELLTDGEKKNFVVPNEWIYAIPDSLRRKDKIVFYEVTAEVLNAGRDQRNATSGGADGADANGALPVYRQLADVSDRISATNAELYETVVSYVKDSAAREVLTTSSVDRLDASSSIHSIEIIATAEDMNRLAAKVASGSKFIIGYAGEE